MTEFRRPAIRIKQDKRYLFLTFLTVRDFMAGDKHNVFYRIDRLDVKEGKGMQRLLDEARARSFGKDIMAANQQREAFLPTSVFLATSGNISYDESKKELFFDSSPQTGVCPLDVVDGQHRIEGLRHAAEKDARLLDFPISAVIAPNLSKAEKMLQFVVVNTKQRPVDSGVAQHITARFTRMLEVEKLPYLPAWLKTKAAKGDDDRALSIAVAFNEDEESPWYGRIQLADEAKDKKRHTITQASFVKSIKRVILAKNHPINLLPENKRIPVMRNYWRAVSDICVAQPDGLSTEINSVVFKHNGLEFFHLIFAPIVSHLARSMEYTEDKMKECLMSVQLPPEAAGVLSPEYWQRGGPASGLNSAGIQSMGAHFREAMVEFSGDEVQV